MRLVVDLQAVQAAWDGAAARSQVQALRRFAEASPQHKVFVLLSAAWPNTVLPLRELLDPALGARAVHLWQPLAQPAASQVLRRGCIAAFAPHGVLVPLACGDADPACAVQDPALGVTYRVSDQSADVALQELAAAALQENSFDPAALQGRRPRLAFVSPLPPARSGISDYSAELLPALARYYDIEVVVTEPSALTDAWVLEHLQVRSVPWFSQNAQRFDRVLYQMGNSVFHEHMFALLKEHPGTVVLHDFHLGHVLSSMELRGIGDRIWSRALTSHGYTAVAATARADSREDALWRYPASLPVITAAEGVIVHSHQASLLAQQWYGPDAAPCWAEVPLLRAPVPSDALRRASARQALGVRPDSFVVCNFGMTGPLKLNHRLLDAWLASPLADDPAAHLVFVGANDEGPYGHVLRERVASEGQGRVSITGWVDMTRYRQWLDAADAAVQLRARSRGETSAAALDCLNHGVPTVVNAHGSLTELPGDTVLKVPDAFKARELAAALQRLRSDEQLRARLAQAGRAHVAATHAPAACALGYARAIENFHHSAPGLMPLLAAAVRDAIGPVSSQEAALLARQLDVSLPARGPRRLLVDVSAICRTDLRTGIQRVVRAILMQLLADPPPGMAVEPVSIIPAEGRWHLRQAARYTLDLLGAQGVLLDDEVVEPRAGDVYLGLDLAGSYVVGAQAAGLYREWRARGVAIHFVVYDLLPVSLPDCFPPEEVANFRRWLDVVADHDGAYCISRAVAQEFLRWRAAVHPDAPPMAVGHFHLGADIEDSTPTRGLPAGHEKMLAALRLRPSLLMVGTVEPRKGHAQALDAMELLWARGSQTNLVVVGKAGWHVEDLVARLRSHPQAGERLFWLEGISDEYLEMIYAGATALLAASRGEGFGLPLIEAAQHGVPIIARDLPVFREVAGEFAYYFSANTPPDLADSIARWLHLYREGRHPRSRGLPWLSWKDSALQLREQLWQALATAAPRPPDQTSIRAD